MMKKYISVIKIQWASLFTYKFDVFSSAFLSIFKIILAYLLWKNIYAYQSVVGDLSFSAMMTYYILISFLTSVDQSENIAYAISGDIRQGSFSKYLTRPISLMGYYISAATARNLYSLFFSAVGFCFWMIFFNQYIAVTLGWNLLLGILIWLMGLIFMMMFNYFLTLLSFLILNISAFFLLKNNIVEFMVGGLIPLSLLPNGVLSVIKLFPFYHVGYYPVMLMLGQTDEPPFYSMLLLLFWIVLFFLVNQLFFRYAKKKYEGVGI